MKSFFSNKYIKTIIFVLMVIFICVILEKKVYINDLSIHRIIIYMFLCSFAFINSFFDYKKVWKFIFEKRFYLGLIFFAFMVAMGYNTSSLYQYNNYVQPNNKTVDGAPFLNEARAIRSDEFLASTPVLFSQKIRNISSFNNAMMATKSSVLLFPKLTTFNISVITSPQLMGFMFLDLEHGFSFFTLLPWFFSFFAIFEFLLLMTRKKKILSLTGTLLLLFSPTILWWNSPMYLGTGFMCLLMFDKFLKSKNWKHHLLYSILVGIFGSMFAGLSYPAWQIPYGYMYLILMIWLVIENKEKIKAKDFLYSLVAIAVVVIILLPAYIGSSDTLKLLSNTIYPGARDSHGGNGWEYLFIYISNILFGVRKNTNPCEFSQFISLYPVPILMGIIQIIKNIKEKAKDLLLILLTAFAVLLSLWNYVNIGVLSKITFLYLSTPMRSQAIVGCICVLLIIRLISNYENTKINNKRVLIGLTVSIITILIAAVVNEKMMIGYLTTIRTAFIVILFLLLLTMLFINNKYWNKVLLSILLMISIVSVVTINPLSKGISVVTEKPVAKKIQKIVKKDKNAVWAAIDASIAMPNYALANGARVINSVNYYPNLKLWKKLDSEGKYEKVYNRYAHIAISLVDTKTSFKLEAVDYFKLKLNCNDVCKLKAKYIISEKSNLNEYIKSNNKMKKIYSEDGTIIYKLTCK